MSIDLSQFVATFLEESYEGLEVMESSLLNLDSADEETINTIFRAAHSIKGGAGTFGFSEVADFTHVVETLLDALRSGEQSVTPDLINLLLESVDCIKALLEASQDGPEADEGMIQNVHSRLQQALSGEVEATVETPSVPATADSSIEVVSTDQTATESAWKISFIPNLDLLQSGHEPAFMFEALADLGDITVEPQVANLPQLPELNPEEIHLSWNITLVSECDESEIQEIFEWVEDECKLSIEKGTIDSDAAPTDSEEQTTGQGWNISFTTDQEFLATGNEPSFMFEALADFGLLNVEANLKKLPVWNKFDPEKLYLDWTLILHSSCSEEEILEIFEWLKMSAT